MFSWGTQRFNHASACLEPREKKSCAEVFKCVCLCEWVECGVHVNWRQLGLLWANSEHLLPSKRALMGSDHICTLPWRLDLVVPNDAMNFFPGRQPEGRARAEQASPTYKSSSPVTRMAPSRSSTQRTDVGMATKASFKDQLLPIHCQEMLVMRDTIDGGYPPGRRITTSYHSQHHTHYLTKNPSRQKSR